MYLVTGLGSSQSLYMFCAIVFTLLQLQKILYNPFTSDVENKSYTVHLLGVIITVCYTRLQICHTKG